MSTEEWWLNSFFQENMTRKHTSQETWDYLFIYIAKIVGYTLSKCSSRKIGAVLVRNRNIISIGFNGSPSGTDLCQNPSAECPRKKMLLQSGTHLELCPAQHAEENTIAQAAKHGISTQGATLYAWCSIPCQRCAGALINAGITRIVCLDGQSYDNLSAKLLSDAGVKVLFKKIEDVYRKMD